MRAELRRQPRASRSSCRPSSRTCWSTARRASPSAWRRTSRRTTSARCCRACIYLIDNPDATVAELLDRVKGPDFPLGGKIVTDRATLRKIYEEGTGSIKVQGEWKEEKLGKGKQQIVVTSIPYGVDKGELENDDRRASSRTASCRNCSAWRTSRTRRTACGSCWRSSRAPTRTW